MANTPDEARLKEIPFELPELSSRARGVVGPLLFNHWELHWAIVEGLTVDGLVGMKGITRKSARYIAAQAALAGFTIPER